MVKIVLTKKNKIHEGKAKIIFESDDSKFVIQHFKDDITAFNNKKKDIIPNKGVINNYISELLMKKIESIGINTHFVKLLNDREQLVRKVNIVPIEVVIRNMAAGSFCKRFGLSERYVFTSPIIEFFLKNDALGDPMISDSYILSFNLFSEKELNEIKLLSLKINSFLCKTFLKSQINLVDFKLEFGKAKVDYGNYQKIILADEISPDNCRLWDVNTKQKLDKDCYRLELGNTVNVYYEVAKRLGISLNF